jgi:hypothetical protein
MQHVLLVAYAILMASKDPKMCKQGTAGNRMHVSLTIPQKLQITSRLESGKNQKRGYGFIHQTVNYLQYEQKHQLLSFMTPTQQKVISKSNTV